MPSVVWKFPIRLNRDVGDDNVACVEMPYDADVISAVALGDVLAVYARIDSHEMQTVTRYILVAGTGHDLDEAVLGAQFLGTVVFGELVYHVWDLGE